jgi:hypothetical protein
MLLTYHDVPLKVIATHRVQRKMEYSDDGTTYLYTAWLIDTTSVLNPAAAAMVMRGELGNVNGAPSPYTIDGAIRKRLSVPSQSLVVSPDGAQLLSVSAPTDARSGPFPEVVSIEKIMGTKTLIIRFRIRAFVVENDPLAGNNEQSQYVLSHRWSMIETDDVDHYPARVVNGVAVLHAGRLFANQDKINPNTFITADQFRRAFFHPITNGWRRTDIEVNVASDNAMLTYSFTDRLDPVKWVSARGRPYPFTRIEAVHSSDMTAPQVFLEQLGAVVRKIGMGALNAWGMVENRNVPDGGKRFEEPLIELQRRLRTSHAQTVLVRVYGDAGTSRTNMIEMAAGIVYGKLQHYIAQYGFTPAHETILTRELTGKFVELSVVVRPGPVARILSELKIPEIPRGFRVEKTPDGFKIVPIRQDDEIAQEAEHRANLEPKLEGIAPYDPVPDQTEDVFDRKGRLLLTAKAVAPQCPPAERASRSSPNVRAQLISLITQALEHPNNLPETPDATVFISTRKDL